MKREEGEADDERGSRETNKGILELKKQLEAKAKKPRLGQTSVKILGENCPN